MENLLFDLKFLGQLILLFFIGWLFGHLLKLDKIYENMHKKNSLKK